MFEKNRKKEKGPHPFYHKIYDLRSLIKDLRSDLRGLRGLSPFLDFFLIEDLGTRARKIGKKSRKKIAKKSAIEPGKLPCAHVRALISAQRAE